MASTSSASPRRPRALAAPLLYWSASAALVIWILVLVAWRERPPAPQPATVAATRFSAARAWPVLSHLADTIGYRVAGSPGADRAAAYLRRTLQGIPGLEVAVQDVSGAWRYPRAGRIIGYTVRNVLARVPGRSRDAVLLSAHYDAALGSVGAADDGVAVAALVEVARALAQGPRLAHSVIINLNDGEELGLAGSAGFLQSPWAGDVRAFVNLESAGLWGKSILFQAGPGNPWLTAVYARAVPFPYGTVLAQDIFQSGAIPSDTDFRVYRDVGGLRGLDIAFYLGGWAYHTQRDRTWNVMPGSLQQMGANTLALARALADGPLPGNVSPERAVYFDVLGLFMVSYPAHVARILAVLALVLGTGALALGLRRRAFTASRLALVLGGVLTSLAAALAVAVGLGALAAYVAGRPMSWFAHPAPGIAAFALAALSGMLAVHAALAGWFRRRGWGVLHSAGAVEGAALLFWMLLLLLLTIAGLGSAYIPLLWVVGGALALLAQPHVRSARWWIPALAGALPATVLTLQLLITLTGLFVPVFGRMPLPVAPDLVLAALVAVPSALVALALMPGAWRAGHLWGAALASGTLALLAMGGSLAQPRYTTLRPQRLAVVHEQSDSTSEVRVEGEDFMTPRAALALLPDMRPAPGSGARPLVWEQPAPRADLAAPSLQLLAARMDSAAGTRTITLRAMAPGAVLLRMEMPAARVAGWSLPLPFTAGRRAAIGVDYVAPPDTGWVFTLQLRGEAPLSVRLAAVRTRTTRDAAQVIRALPSWTDVHAIAVSSTTVER